MDSQREGSRSHIDSFHKVTLEDTDRDDLGHEQDTVEDVNNVNKKDHFFLDKAIEKSGVDGDIKTKLSNFLIDLKFDAPPVVGYLKGITHKSFDLWLRDNPPSREVKGLQWITVILNYGDSDDDSDDDYDDDSDDGSDDDSDDDSDSESELDKLLDSWKSLVSAGQPITKQCILELAVKHKVLSGKWMFWANSGGKIDHLWSVVARGIIEGDLGKVCNNSKVSPYKPGMYSNHVVCIYNTDCSDRTDILQLEAAIRNTGLFCQLVYKPDIYTYLGIYSGNKYGLSPVVMKSQFDVKKRMSIITDI